MDTLRRFWRAWCAAWAAWLAAFRQEWHGPPAPEPPPVPIAEKVSVATPADTFEISTGLLEDAVRIVKQLREGRVVEVHYASQRDGKDAWKRERRQWEAEAGETVVGAQLYVNDHLRGVWPQER